MYGVRLAIALVLLSMNYGPPAIQHPIGAPVLLVVGSTLAFLGAALYFAYRTIQQLRTPAIPPFRTLTNFRRLSRLYYPLSLALFVVQSLFLGWGAFIQHAFAGWFLIGHLIFLVPLIITQAMGTVLFHAVELAVDHRTRRTGFVVVRENPLSTLLLRIREEHGLWMGTVLLVTVVQDALDHFAPNASDQPLVALLLIVLVAITSLAFIPFLLRLVWSFHPLPEGTLRTALVEQTRRENTYLADILVWKTRQPIANAGVAGLIPRFRFVFLSETMLENLTPTEIGGVFGHEIGHIKNRHLLFFLVLIPLSLVALVLLGDWLDATTAAPWSRLLALIPSFFWLAIPFFAIVILALSRRFEKQADLAGCRALARELSGGHLTPEAVRLFMHTLEKVCLINGTDLDQWMWRHGRVSDRLRFLEKVAHTPVLASRFDFQTRLLCRSLLAALAGVVLLFWPRLLV